MRTSALNSNLRDGKATSVMPLAFIADTIRSKIGRLENTQIQNIDVTEDLYKELKSRIDAKALIALTVGGEVTSGKSTVGLLLMDFINGYIETKRKKIIDRYSAICQDEIEFNRKTIDEDENICYLIDEHSSMANTGENASTEKAFFETNNSMSAQRYKHRIMITPSKYHLYEKDAPISLIVIGRDEDLMRTTCKVIYRDVYSGEQTELGFAYFYVEDIINKEWYTRYRSKKFRRLDLLQKHGFRDIRELEYSALVLDTYNELKDYINAYSKVSSGFVGLKVRELTQRRKMPASIILKTYVERPVIDLLNSLQDAKKLSVKIQREQDINKKIEMQKALDSLSKIHETAVQREKENVLLMEKYYGIEG